MRSRNWRISSWEAFSSIGRLLSETPNVSCSICLTPKITSMAMLISNKVMAPNAMARRWPILNLFKGGSSVWC